MSKLVQCKNDIVRYRNLKSNLNSITAILFSAIHDAGDFNNEIKAKYLINENPAPISLGILKLKSDIKETCDYLNNVVKPAIDSEINDLQRKKVYLEHEERERKKREERKERAE